jgi:hypothetical protein
MQNYQEMKNFEFFFKPQVIQKHVSMQFGQMGESQCEGMATDAYKGDYQQTCSMEIDEIPTEEELIRALMT